MSMGLDSPMEMEMIAINYLKNYAFLATHFWAWIAFFTAAISFSWKIKSSIIHSSSNHQPPNPILDDDDDDDDDNDELLSTTTSIPAAAAAANYSSTTTFYRLENRRSGKFSLHYDDNINVHKDEEYLEQEDKGMGVVVDYDEEQEESMMITSTNSSLPIKHNNNNHNYNYKDDGYLKMKMQTREMGWYIYQDLSILDGNVVRLWSNTHHPSTFFY